MTGHLNILIELLDAAVLSADAATAGSHRSLPIVPGAALLGHAAGRLYGELASEDLALSAFHTGEVSFGDGLPVAPDGRVGFPVPMSLHRPKAGGAVTDLSQSPRGQEQWMQEREGFVDSAGMAVTLAPRGYRLRTAIAPDTGTAATGMLFGYETLPAGSRFVARIAGPDHLLDRLRPAFDGVTMRLGRSRSTEHGRARAQVIGPLDELPCKSRSDGVATVWALSDLCLVDGAGQPVLQPTAADLGFLNGSVDWDRTFIRARRYAAWNAKLNARMAERVVISRGSVITLTGTDGAAGFRQVGTFHEAGLGRCVVNALPLAGDGLNPIKLEISAALEAAQDEPDSDVGFLDWLRRRAGGVTGADAWAIEKVGQLAGIYAALRLYQAIPANDPAGPTAAQWGAVLEAARSAASLEILDASLFRDRGDAGGSGLCGDEPWIDAYGLGPSDTLAHWLRARLQEAKGRRFGAEAIAILAREARSTDRKERAAARLQP